MEDEMFKHIIEVKDTSELMIDLAYSALLYDNREIAEEVLILEEVVDRLNQVIQREAVKGSLEDRNVEKALVLIRLANSIESVADSAVEIADIVLRDIDPHPVFKLSMRESDVIITKLEVMSNSPLIGKSMGELKMASETGMWVVAIKGKQKWVYGPNESTLLYEGDQIFARGPIDGEDLLRQLCGHQPPEED